MESPTQELSAIVRRMLAELRGASAPEVRPDAELERDLGIDSLSRVELVLRIEQSFGVRLPETTLAEARTLRDLVAGLAAMDSRFSPEPATQAPLSAPAACAPEVPPPAADAPQPPRGLLYALYAWAVFFLCIGIGAAVLLVLPFARLRERWTRLVARMLLRASFIPVRVRGSVKAAPAVFVVNHSSYIDSLVLSAVLPAGTRFAAKREFANTPVMRTLLARIGTRFVERFDTGRAIEDARELAEAARRGETLAIFPEGTFWRAPGLREFRMGAFVAAAQGDRPVVPVALRGTRSVLPDGTWRPRRLPVEVVIGEPLHARGSAWSDALALRDAARAFILANCAEADRDA